MHVALYVRMPDCVHEEGVRRVRHSPLPLGTCHHNITALPNPDHSRFRCPEPVSVLRSLGLSEGCSPVQTSHSNEWNKNTRVRASEHRTVNPDPVDLGRNYNLSALIRDSRGKAPTAIRLRRYST